ETPDARSTPNASAPQTHASAPGSADSGPENGNQEPPRTRRATRQSVQSHNGVGSTSAGKRSPQVRLSKSSAAVRKLSTSPLAPAGQDADHRTSAELRFTAKTSRRRDCAEWPVAAHTTRNAPLSPAARRVEIGESTAGERGIRRGTCNDDSTTAPR